MNDSILEFLDRSPTAWHAVKELTAILKKAGFQEVVEQEPWQLKSGNRYFVTRNGSSLAAFVVPNQTPTALQLIASHTDSPGFKLKPNPEFYRNNMILWGMELYGSPLIASWLNRDLGVAGRVVYVDEQDQKQMALVRLDRSPVIFPQLAIHLDREVNDKGVMLHKQDQLAVLAAIKSQNETEEGYLLHLLKQELSIKKLLSSDLFLFPLEQARFIGNNQEMIASYRIDNLMSAFASVKSLSKVEIHNDCLNMVISWDNEEIGSNTSQGASSTFFHSIAERIALSLKMPREAYLRLLASSLCVSSDLAHALHPNYNDRHEPQHPVLLGKGIAIKEDAQQRYASDAYSIGEFQFLCHRYSIPTQAFVTRGDIRAGTTIGPLHATVTGMPTVDIGIPQLSMHSCREVCAVEDFLNLGKAFDHFFERQRTAGTTETTRTAGKGQQRH